MDPVPLIAVKQGSYAPKPTLPQPAANMDAEAVAQIARVPLHPQASIHEFNQDVKQAADQAAQDIQQFIASQQRSVRISKDEVSGHMVVQLIDPSSGQVIRTLPNEELLRLARTFQTLGSVMVNQRA
jgi:flagellar protein FlaG